MLEIPPNRYTNPAASPGMDKYTQLSAPATIPPRIIRTPVVLDDLLLPKNERIKQSTMMPMTK